MLLELNPALAQDILQEFPRGLADAVLQSVSPVIAMQWERNAAYPDGTIGRLMEPVVAVFRPQQTVGETVEQLRHLIKTAFITYGYVIAARRAVDRHHHDARPPVRGGRDAPRRADAARALLPEARPAARTRR